MSIRKIEKSEIDFSKVYGSQASADAQDGNTVKVKQEYWGDTGDLYFDDETGMVSEDGVGIGFINKNDILSIDKNIEPKDYTKIQDTKAAQMQKKMDGVEEFVSHEEETEDLGEVEPILTNEDNLDESQVIEEVKMDYTPDETEVNIEDIVPEAVETPSSEFNFKHEESNILAAKAKEMGFTDDQIALAIGISRWETGNYEHLCGGYNYGGVTGKGDAGSVILKGREYAQYSSMDAGMDAFLDNLKRNYFDMGLNTIEDIDRKYLGYEDGGNWAKGVRGCMS